jgi:hypothetical protein
MFARFRKLVLVAAVIGGPSLAHAQQTSAEAAVPPAPVPAAGPRLDVTATAVRKVTQGADSAASMQRRRQSAGKPVALMIVGGAAIVLGAVIGDAPGTLFMIGGAVALLVGLYQYLQ